MRITSTIFAIFFVLAGCGEGSLVPVETHQPGNSPSEPTTPVPGDEPQNPSEPTYSLEITTALPLAIAPYATREISVRLFVDGEAMEAEEIRFSIEGETGGSRLGATRSRTDSNGMAHVDIIAGGDAFEFQVKIDSNYTEPVRASVEIMGQDMAPAALRVQISYRDQSRQPVSTVSVSVHDAEIFGCADLFAETLPTAFERRSMNLTDSLVFDGFAHEQAVTVLAIGHNQVAAVAEGCVEGIVLTGGEEEGVQVALTRKELDPTGSYAFETVLDTRGAVPGQAGAFIEVVAAIFEHPDDPARFLVGLLEDRSGFSFGFMRETAISYLDSLIRSIVPSRFLNMFEYVGDAARVVTNMSFEGTLTIYESEDGGFLADERWETVIFQWRAGCNPSANPGCDEHRIALRNTHIGEIIATYDVVVDEQVLRIASHQRALQYARFFHLFILEIVYPYIVAGASNSSELLQGAVDCVAVAFALDDADGVSDGDLDIGIARISVDALEGYCLTGLGAVGAMVDGYLDSLATDLQSPLTLEGAAVMNDESRNLRPESLTGGVWNGIIGVDGQDHGARGTFEAVRIGNGR